MKKNKVVVVLSGGMDSSALLVWAIAKNYDVTAITIDYGQRHRKEIGYAKLLCDGLLVEHKIVDLSSLKTLMGNTALTGDIDVPEGHYAAPTMKLTVVPNRNMVLLSTAICLAAECGASKVLYGAHSGDHPIYPDCRPEFVERLSRAAEVCWYDKITIEAPFVEKTKAEIVSIGAGLGLLWALTWSCYKGGETHCGSCGTCVERREAFMLAGVDDPTNYVDTTPIKTLIESMAE